MVEELGLGFNVDVSSTYLVSVQPYNIDKKYCSWLDPGLNCAEMVLLAYAYAYAFSHHLSPSGNFMYQALPL